MVPPPLMQLCPESSHFIPSPYPAQELRILSSNYILVPPFLRISMSTNFIQTHHFLSTYCNHLLTSSSSTSSFYFFYKAFSVPMQMQIGSCHFSHGFTASFYSQIDLSSKLFYSFKRVDTKTV